ncbi:MAG TPA: hypothetical protein VG844_14020 [Terracidiphilus sp.]|jgi:hypothetical protein|nr:hypothetical protein [Terracidiphilus sp.]
MATRTQSFESVQSMHPATRAAIAFSSLALVLLQSVCTFFTALSGLRLIIGVAALATVTQAGVVWDHFHADWLRIPMLTLAFAGSALNLAILRRIHRLRRNSATHWRQPSPSSRKLFSERLQLILSIATLALIALEELTHFQTFHHF